MSNVAIKELLYKMADDDLIIGHRNSEWTGIGPVLEEDIAFSSQAQDKIGHALAIYEILHKMLGEEHPDKIAFSRRENEFKSCHLVELPIGEYDFSLMRNVLFNHAEILRFQALAESSFVPLAQLATKIKGELKYHIMHSNTWIRQLGNGSEESNARMQTALNEAFPYALGIFEKGDHEDELINEKIFIGEDVLKNRWLERIEPVLIEANLKMPDPSMDAVEGGRKGYHTEHLQSLLDEMTEVFNLDPTAEW